MKPATKDILTAVLAGDDTITGDEAARVIEFLSGSVVALHQRDSVVSVSEAARRIGKGRFTIYRMVRNGILKPFKPRAGAPTSGIYESSLAILGV